MALILDTSVLIEVERGSLELSDLAGCYPDEEFMCAAITISELLHGMHRAKNSQLRGFRQIFIESIIEKFEILPFDLASARVHGKLWAELSAKGISIGAHDSQIAAVALANHSKLVSRDKKSFPRVSGLQVIQW